MGLYDTVKIFTKCPYCGVMETFSGQTKELGKYMNTYKTVQWFDSPSSTEYDINVLGGHISTIWLDDFMEFRHDLEKVNVTICCNSSLCQWWADRRDVKWQGIPSGFGRMFHCDVPVEEINGKRYLIGKPINMKLDDLTEQGLADWEEHLDPNDRLFYEKALKKLKYPPFALRYRHRFGKD